MRWFRVFGAAAAVGTASSARASDMLGGSGARRGADHYATLGSRGFGSIRSFGKEAAGFGLNGKVPTKSRDGFEVATLAGGCFWGTELHLQRVSGVVATCVGYTQGRLDRPTYKEVRMRPERRPICASRALPRSVCRRDSRALHRVRRCALATRATRRRCS